MGLSALRITALASALGLAGLTPAAAAPILAPDRPSVQTSVIQVQDATTIRRDRLHRDDGGAWKKKRHHFRDRRDDRRDHGRRVHERRDDLYRPRATQKFAYDEHGNLRIYDGDGRDRDWRDKDGRKRKRPRLYKTQSLGYREPSPELRGILTTVPD